MPRSCTCAVLAQSHVGKRCEDAGCSRMRGAAEEAATIEGCQSWAQAGPSKSQREHCRIERRLLGDFAQHLASRAGTVLAKDARVSPHATRKSNVVTDDGAERSEPSTSMTDGLPRLIRKLHMPHFRFNNKNHLGTHRTSAVCRKAYPAVQAATGPSCTDSVRTARLESWFLWLWCSLAPPKAA